MTRAAMTRAAMTRAVMTKVTMIRDGASGSIAKTMGRNGGIEKDLMVCAYSSSTSMECLILISPQENG